MFILKTSEVLVLFALSVVLCVVQVKGDVEHFTDIWNNMKNENCKDIENVILFAKTLKDEQTAIAELQTTVRRYLRTKNSLLLAIALSTNGLSDTSAKLKDLSKNMTKNYDMQLIEDILYDAINEVFNSQSPSALIDSILHVYTDGDLTSFELMLRAQIKLMHFYNEKSQYDDKEFLRKYAFTLYKIKQDNLYDSVKGYLKSALDRVVAKLPNNLQYLFFNPYFCLMNAHFSEYVYTAMKQKIDAGSRYVWVWFEKNKIDDTGHIKAEIFESNAGNNTHFKVTLKGIKYQLYYYKMPATNLIAGWESTEKPIYNIWDIEFLDNDRVAFLQDDYIMCSNYDKYDSERRIVAAYKDENASTMKTECQWFLGTCDRTII